MKATSASSSAKVFGPLLRWAWLTALLVTAGCAHISDLREAQDLFNQASTTRNQAIFQDNDLSGINRDNLSTNLGHAANSPLTNPKVLYAEARDRLKRLDGADDARRLRRDGLMGHKLTLQALCHLELDEFDEARDAAARAKQEAQDAAKEPRRTPPDARDRLLGQAMPGLIALKQAVKELGPRTRGEVAVEDDWLAEFQRQLIGPRDDQGKPSQADEWNVLAYLKAARDEGATHPVCTYFTMCQLSAFRYVQQAHEAQGFEAGHTRFDRLYKEEVVEYLKQLKDDLPLRRGQPRSAPLVAEEEDMLASWVSFFGYSRPALGL